MSNLDERFAAFAADVSQAVRPRSAAAVRKRGERNRLRFAAGTAVAAAGVAALGTTALLQPAGGTGGGGGPNDFPATLKLAGEGAPDFVRNDDPAAPPVFTGCGPAQTLPGQVDSIVGDSVVTGENMRPWDPNYSQPSTGAIKLPTAPPVDYPADPVPSEARLRQQYLLFNSAGAATSAANSLLQNLESCGWLSSSSPHGPVFLVWRIGPNGPEMLHGEVYGRVVLLVFATPTRAGSMDKPVDLSWVSLTARTRVCEAMQQVCDRDPQDTATPIFPSAPTVGASNLPTPWPDDPLGIAVGPSGAVAFFPSQPVVQVPSPSESTK